MNACLACGKSSMVTEIVPRYDDDAFGIPVTIRNAVLRHRCGECGMDGVEVPEPERLEAAIAVARIQNPIALSGDHIRALRKACGMTGKQFAAALGVDNATLSRWENAPASSADAHGDPSDRNIRQTVWALLYQRAPAMHVEPGFFTRLRIQRLPEGGTFPRMVLERVRLVDRIHHTKTTEWDLWGMAA